MVLLTQIWIPQNEYCHKMWVVVAASIDLVDKTSELIILTSRYKSNTFRKTFKNHERIV